MLNAGKECLDPTPEGWRRNLRMFRNASDLSDEVCGHLTYNASIVILSSHSFKEPISKWLKLSPAPNLLNQYLCG